ncbi:MAG TPA: outer membrane beta-barrel protein [Thermoanaerobaculia bacterium]|nr:outer membrane beta-barrel protein [Thermoanaerobaculia bacterium]
MRSLVQILIAILLSVPLLAQSSQQMRDRDPDLEAVKRLAGELQAANFHYGPWYLLSRIRIADAGFTETASLPTGDSTGGVSLTIEAPNRLYLVPRKKTIFTLELTPGYSFIGSGEETGQFGYTARGDMHLLLNHLYLDVYGMREDALRAHVADVNRLVTLRNDEAGVGGEMKYSSRTSALFNIRLRDLSFPERRFQPEDVPVNILDRKEKNGRLSLMHKTFPKTSFFVSGERSDYDFERATYKDSTRTFYGGGAIYNSGRTTVRLEGGPVKLDFDDPLEQDFSGLTASFRAQRNDGRRTYTFGAHRDLGFSIYAFNNYFVSNTLIAAVSHVATRRLSLRAQSTYERDDYDVPVGGIDRRDTISYSSVGFIYAIRRLSLGADVGWYERDSTTGGDLDSGIRTVLHLSFTP